MDKIGVLMLTSPTKFQINMLANLSKNNELIYNHTSPFGDYDNTLLFSNTYNTNTHVGKALAFIKNGFEKYRFDRFLVISNNVIPKLISYKTLMTYPGDRTRFVFKDRIITPNEAAKALEGQVDKLKKQHQTFLKENNNESEVLSANQYITPNGVKLRPYQSTLVDYIINHNRSGLFVDMGLGKTLSTLAAINELEKQGKLDKTRPVLIVAPIMVALDTWSREADKWGYDYDVLTNIRLSGKKRNALFNELLTPRKKLTLVTTNPAQLPQLLKFLRENNQQNLFQMAVVDELSQFKSVKTNRFKNLSALTQQCEYFIGLTGTPAPNNLLDLYSEVIAIDPNLKFKLGYNFFAYRKHYFKPGFTSPSGIVYRWDLKPQSEHEIYSAISSNVISMQSDGLIDLPDIVYDNRYVELPTKAHKLYHKLATEIRKELAKADETDETVSINIDNKQQVTMANSAVLTSKLLQLSSGAIYNDRDNNEIVDDDNYQVYQDEKFKMLKDIVETSNSPVLVFFYFKSELERMKKYFKFEFLDPSHPQKAKNTIKRWNNGEIPVLVAHPASAGHGLNLQDGGHIMVWLTLPWSNEQYRQSIKRLYRSGQKHTVSVIRILAQDTIDEEVMQKLDAKENSQQRLLLALKLN